MEQFLTVLDSCSAEINEKRSRFIATVAHVESEQEAFDFIAKMKTEYWDARHNVYAFVLSENNIARYSDDNEPHGTAGKPVLDVIVGKGLKNVVVVVTRYFGGILLGTGGLVRAYSSSAAQVLEKAELYAMRECLSYKFVCEYNQFEILKNILERFSANITDTVFDTKITVFANFQEDFAENLLETVKNSLNGQVEAVYQGDFCAPFKK